MKKQFYPGGLTAEEHLDRILGVDPLSPLDADNLAREIREREKAEEIRKRKMAAKWNGEHIRTVGKA
jgi:hypothetical protein